MKKWVTLGLILLLNLMGKSVVAEDDEAMPGSFAYPERSDSENPTSPEPDPLRSAQPGLNNYGVDPYAVRPGEDPYSDTQDPYEKKMLSNPFDPSRINMPRDPSENGIKNPSDAIPAPESQDRNGDDDEDDGGMRKAFQFRK